MTKASKLKVGDRVTFELFWDGKARQLEGFITEFEPHEIQGVVMVKFDASKTSSLGEVQR